MVLINQIINVASKQTNKAIGLGVRKWIKPANCFDLKYIPHNVDKFSHKIQSLKTPKEIISDAIGENCKISRDWQDLGTFSGIKAFFSYPTSHYIYFCPKGRGHISCHYDRNKLLEKFYVFNSNTKSIRQFNGNGKLMVQYTPEETYAIMLYKHDSRNIHKVLREGKIPKNEAQINDCIKSLKELYAKGKTSKTTEEIIGYRALDAVSLKNILSMPEDGMIFTDPSFMSIATDKKKIIQFLNFKNYNHVMKVIIPKDTQYLAMDDLAHIINPQTPETELVLNAGSQLLIKKRDGMIIAELIN